MSHDISTLRGQNQEKILKTARTSKSPPLSLQSLALQTNVASEGSTAVTRHSEGVRKLLLRFPTGESERKHT